MIATPSSRLSTKWRSPCSANSCARCSKRPTTSCSIRRRRHSPATSSASISIRCVSCACSVQRSSRRFRIRWKMRCRKRSEEHTSELQSLMRISYAVFCLKKKNTHINLQQKTIITETKQKHYYVPQQPSNHNTKHKLIRDVDHIDPITKTAIH